LRGFGFHSIRFLDIPARIISSVATLKPRALAVVIMAPLFCPRASALHQEKPSATSAPLRGSARSIMNDLAAVTSRAETPRHSL
jgi:hypothetical protein